MKHHLTCFQNDPGSAADPMTGARHFTTYMKARIYCEREVPTGREFTDSLDYQYNEISEWIIQVILSLHTHTHTHTHTYTHTHTHIHIYTHAHIQHAHAHKHIQEKYKHTNK